MNRAALYARFSTDKQREESIDDQFHTGEKVAKANGLHVVARFEDRGITAGTQDRPGYQALLSAARAGAYDVIVTEDISRLWRNRAEFGQRSAELEDLGVHLVTAVGDDTRRDGWGLLLGIKSAIAEHQRREISYRTRRGLEGLARSGKSVGGRCYGYGSEAEADTVRRLYRDRLAGLELREMVAGLTRAGTPAPRGYRWSYNTVKRILANPRYKGVMVWGATERKGGAQDSRRHHHVPRADGPLVVRAIEPLVAPATWDAVNRGAMTT